MTPIPPPPVSIGPLLPVLVVVATGALVLAQRAERQRLSAALTGDDRLLDD